VEAIAIMLAKILPTREKRGCSLARLALDAGAGIRRDGRRAH